MTRWSSGYCPRYRGDTCGRIQPGAEFKTAAQLPSPSEKFKTRAASTCTWSGAPEARGQRRNVTLLNPVYNASHVCSSPLIYFLADSFSFPFFSYPAPSLSFSLSRARARGSVLPYYVIAR